MTAVISLYSTHNSSQSNQIRYLKPNTIGVLRCSVVPKQGTISEFIKKLTLYMKPRGLNSLSIMSIGIIEVSLVLQCQPKNSSNATWKASSSGYSGRLFIGSCAPRSLIL